MLDQLNALLRQRLKDDNDVETAGPVDEQVPSKVTPFTPAPASPKLGDMSDRAEAAVDELSETLKDWFETDLRVLFEAWQHFDEAQTVSPSIKQVFHAAHNLSGMGDTYGEFEIGRICRSLCKLINSGISNRNIALARLHIDACRAINSSKGTTENADAICAALETEVEKQRAA